MPTLSAYQDFSLTDGTNTVAFKILNNQSPEDSVGSNSKRRTIQYEIAFRDFGKAQKLLIGYPEFATLDDGTNYLSRNVPHLYLDPNGAKLYCTGISRAVGMQPKPLTNATDDPYQYTHLTAVYETLPYLILDDDEFFVKAGDPTFLEIGAKKLWRYIEVGEVASTSKVFKQMMGGYRFCKQVIGAYVPGRNEIPFSDGTINYVMDQQAAVTQGVPFDYREQVIELIWHHIPRDNAPLNIAFALQNTINDRPLWIWPRHTVMLDTVKPEFSLEVDGSYSWKLRYRFRINLNGSVVDPVTRVITPGGWLYLPNPNAANLFQRVANPAHLDKPLFPDSNFDLLFTPVAA
jgi:hypothetical protein